MKGVPGVMALLSHGFLFFSSSLKVLPIAEGTKRCYLRVFNDVAKKRTLPERNGLFPCLFLLFSLLG